MDSEQTGKRRILLVDDDTSLLETLGDFLRYEGYEVVTATSGEQALQKLSLNPPDIVILDMGMPGMGGMGFLDRITNADGSTRYPVLVLTARAAMASYFADKQIDGFIAKPCDPADLLTEVSRVIFLRGGELPRPAETSLVPVVLGENDPLLNKKLTAALAEAGCAVKACLTGPDALESAVTTRPAVLVLRLELPGMSADEVCRLLRRLPGTRLTPVVVYGVDAPDAQLEHVAGLDAAQVRLVQDLSVNHVLRAVRSCFPT
jgi:DNA-binding response OmpR family regulator